MGRDGTPGRRRRGTGVGAAPPPSRHSPNQTVCRARFGSDLGISESLFADDEGPEVSVLKEGEFSVKRHLSENALAMLEVKKKPETLLFLGISLYESYLHVNEKMHSRECKHAGTNRSRDVGFV